MSKRDIAIILEDIIESIKKIKAYTHKITYKEFISDHKTIDAVIRNLEIIGEAANRVPESIREENPQIEWHRVIGLRNRIIHEYFGVDNQIIWHIVQKDLKQLKQRIKSIKRK